MIDKKRRSRNLTLSDIIRGTLHCVNAGSEIAEQHYISTLDKFFNPDGSPVTKEVKINGNIKMNIPLICLSNHTNIDFEEIRIKTTLNLDELTQKDFESGLCFGNDSYQFTRGSFSAPLVAAVKAQSEMSQSLAHFIQDVGIDKDGNMRMVTLKHAEQLTDPGNPSQSSSQERYIQAPFLAMTGLPNLAIDTADISFDLEVSTAEDDAAKNSADSQVTSEYKSWWSPVTAKFTGNVTHSSEQTRHTDTRAKYSFNISASKQRTPEAFMRIIAAVTNAVALPSSSQPANSAPLIDSSSSAQQGA